MGLEIRLDTEAWSRLLSSALFLSSSFTFGILSLARVEVPVYDIIRFTFFFVDVDQAAFVRLLQNSNVGILSQTLFREIVLTFDHLFYGATPVVPT